MKQTCNYRPGIGGAPDCGLNDSCQILGLKVVKLEKALDAMVHYFLPEVRRGPAYDKWLEAARLFLAVRPQHELAEDLRFYLDIGEGR